MNNSESEPIKPWDDKTAQWYVANYGEHATNYKTIELANLTVVDQVLDIGCGSGTAVRAAAKLVTNGHLVGIDPSPTMVRLAKEKTATDPNQKRIQFFEGGAENVPVKNGSFTVVLAINTIHHWYHVPKGCGEVKRVLQKNGRFIITNEQLAEETDAWRLAKIEQALMNIGFKLLNKNEHQLQDCTMDFLEFELTN